MAETLEVATLGAAPGCTAKDFVEANTDINAYLQRQPGFLWRRIVETDDGRIIDIVAYDSLPHARAGAAGITGEMAGFRVHTTIDHDSVDWQLTTALQYLA